MVVMKKWIKWAIILFVILFVILGGLTIRSLFSENVAQVPISSPQETLGLEEKINDGMFFIDPKTIGLTLYPKTRRIEIEQGEVGHFIIGIRNILENSSGPQSFRNNFSYEILPNPHSMRRCEFNEEEVKGWIRGGEESGIILSGGENTSREILLDIPENLKDCGFALGVKVYHGKDIYLESVMEVAIVEKRIKAGPFIFLGATLIILVALVIYFMKKKK